MKKTKRILLLIAIFAIAVILKSNKVNAAQYQWPMGGSNSNETYIDYEFYGNRNTAPVKDGKSGREYIVDNQKWPSEKYYYSRSESHYGMDITGINGHTYSVISVVDGTVLATSANRIVNPSVNYVDRNQRRTSAGLRDGGGYGNYIVIQETSTGRCFLYAHLKGGSLKVSKGDKVTAGQEIAIMGSSGDSGHMHLHFEIRKSKAVTLNENYYGRHYLVATTSYTNLDPRDYIGSGPDVHTPVTDTKRVQISREDAKYYVKHLYRTVLGREASDSEAEYWVNVYVNNGSIYVVTKGIFLSAEANRNLGDLSNLDFVKKTYEVILYRGSNYTETEMAVHVVRIDDGRWTREDYLAMLCNCNEFVNYRISVIISAEKANETSGNEIPEETPVDTPEDTNTDENSTQIYGLAPADRLTVLGDLNADGHIDATDASICLQLAAYGTSGCSYAVKYADIDNDGRVSASDASYILQYAANVGAGDISNQTPIAQFVRR